MKNALNYVMFGNANIAQQMDSAYRKAIETHNQKVAQNRYVLNIIINCIRFCGSFELALRGHDESESSSNPGIFRGLINFSADLDSAMKTHLEKATVFKGTSKTIQNELLHFMLEICHEEISKEMKESEFVSVMADETSDVSTLSQMVIVYRYLVNFKPVERFWGFFNPGGENAEALAACILTELGRHFQGCEHKLIAQTYDGASVMSGSKHGVQAIIKQNYRCAEYIHCHAHQLNLVMLNAASINKNVKIFFVNLQGLCAFFSSSPQRTAVLDEIVQKRLPRSVPTRWNFQSRSVNTVYEHRTELIECMKVIQQGDRVSNNSSILQASGYIGILNDENFIFWLSFFQRIMPHVDMMFNQLQRRDCTPTTIHTRLNAFEREILKIRSSIIITPAHENPTKKRKTDDQSELKRQAIEVCDIILTQIKDRFRFVDHYGAAILFLPDNFAQYEQTFPEEHVKAALNTYSFVEEKKFRTELSVIYSTEEFRNISGVLPLMEFIRDNNLGSPFSECVKLISAILTIPMTCEAERCFSTLSRIKTSLRNTMTEERLSALAMLSIERDFVMNIRDFNERVIDKFARSKERRADFLYKN